jgi:hypothetical protein
MIIMSACFIVFQQAASRTVGAAASRDTHSTRRNAVGQAGQDSRLHRSWKSWFRFTMTFFACISLGSAALAEPVAVDRIEFFFDQDPGLGAGTEVILEENQRSVSIPVPTESMAPGVHRLHFRARDADGVWGLTSSVAFRITAADDPVVALPVKIEYFLSSDPGVGMGHEVDLELDQRGLPVEVSEMATLSPGVHRLHFRTLDELGRWGLTSSIAVLISEPADGFPIDGFGYLITESDGRVSDEGEIAGLSGAPPILSASLLPSPGLVYLEQHALTVFARDILGFVSKPSPETWFVVMPPDEDWVRQHFSQEEIESGAASFRRDSDGDGASNAEEYAALTDPLDPDSVSRPVVSVEDGFLHLSYDQRSGGTGTPGIDYSVDGVSIIAEASVDRLDAWEGGPDSISVLETSPTDRPGVERVTVRHNEPITSSERGFLRLLYQGP